MERPSGFFHGSELPRLLILAIIMVGGWGFVWHFASGKLARRPEPEVVATANPEPIVADRSVEFETVTDRTAVGFRDNAAYQLLLDRARDKTPNELAAISRRDVFLPHLWQNPQLYRGIPIHLLGTALRILRYPSKLSKTGWIYEASIITPDATRNPFVCVFEDAPPQLPIGPNVSERVVFNGYFLKIWKYQAADAARGAPLLVGRIGWNPPEAPATDGNNALLHWTLVAIAAMFFVSLGRWVYQLYRVVAAPPASPLRSHYAPSEEIDPATLEQWVHSARAGGTGDGYDPDES